VQTLPTPHHTTPHHSVPNSSVPHCAAPHHIAQSQARCVRACILYKSNNTINLLSNKGTSYRGGNFIRDNPPTQQHHLLPDTEHFGWFGSFLQSIPYAIHRATDAGRRSSVSNSRVEPSGTGRNGTGARRAGLSALRGQGRGRRRGKWARGRGLAPLTALEGPLAPVEDGWWEGRNGRAREGRVEESFTRDFWWLWGARRREWGRRVSDVEAKAGRGRVVDCAGLL